jgi:hypothetical protein
MCITATTTTTTATAAVQDVAIDNPQYFCKFMWQGIYDVYYPNVDAATLRESPT